MFCTNDNRIDLSGSPSTCTIDTSLVPLPSIFFLAFLVIHIPYRVLQTQRDAIRTTTPKTPSYDSYSYSTTTEILNGNTASSFVNGPSTKRTYPASGRMPNTVSPNQGGTWEKISRWGHYLYIFFVFCLFALRVLEIVRLVAARMGVGLLPIPMVVSVILIVMLCWNGRGGSKEGGRSVNGLGWGQNRSLVVSASLVFYWALSLIFESIKVTRLVTYESVHAAKGTAYPSSDWVLDNACMLGLFVFSFFWEGAYLVLLWRASLYAQDRDQTDMDVDSSGSLSRLSSAKDYEYTRDGRGQRNIAMSDMSLGLGNESRFANSNISRPKLMMSSTDIV